MALPSWDLSNLDLLCIICCHPVMGEKTEDMKTYKTILTLNMFFLVLIIMHTSTTYILHYCKHTHILHYCTHTHTHNTDTHHGCPSRATKTSVFLLFGLLPLHFFWVFAHICRATSFVVTTEFNGLFPPLLFSWLVLMKWPCLCFSVIRSLCSFSFGLQF